MKRTIYLLLCTMLLIGAGAPISIAQKSAPQIEFEKKTHDFGIIHEEKGKVTCTFDFTNVGTEPLIIYTATATCGCTRPKYPTEPIAPGQKGTISVTYNPAHRAGEISSTVTVKTNDKKNTKVTLRLTGNVVP